MRFLFGTGIVLMIIGIILAVVGFQERSLAATASQAPEEISLKDLIARGPDGNPNIILTDYVLCDNFVYQERNGSWEHAWVPAVPREQAGQNTGGKATQVKALIFTIHARNQHDLAQRCEQPKLRALVTNRIVSLKSQERDLLAKSYPGTDFSKCLIIQEGREPAGPTKLILMIGGGGFAALAGLGMIGAGFGVWLWRRRQAGQLPGTRRLAADDEDQEPEDQPRPRRRPLAAEDDEERPSRR
jgi:hypothetical protein